MRKRIIGLTIIAALAFGGSGVAHADWDWGGGSGSGDYGWGDTGGYCYFGWC